MFECKYKFELEDSLISAKYVYKSQKRKQDNIMAALIPILMILGVIMLIVDIVNKRSVIWDIVILVVLVVLEIIYMVIPLYINRSQKKSYKQQNLAEMDYLLININDTLCTEALYKDDKEVAKNVHSLRALSSYLEDNDRLVLVFNKVEFVCIRKDKLTGGLDKLKALLVKNMSKNVNGKK